MRNLRIVYFLCVLMAASTIVVRAQATTVPLPIPVALPGDGAASPLPETFSNQIHPAPTPTPLPGHVAVSGKLRGYDFQRLNRVQSGTSVNKHATEFSIEPHLDYRIGDTPLNVGYTYGGATGFGLNGPDPIRNPHVDNTLPGFPLNQPVHELYVQYKDSNQAITAGTQELNYPWEPMADARVLPASYEAVDATFKLLPSLSVTGTRILKFEQRNSSDFEPNTLLTAPYPGTTLDRYAPFTPGTLRVAANFHPSLRFVLSAENDEFYDIADLTYAEAKYGLDPYTRANPYVALQYAAEGSLGTNTIGVVDNRTFGTQFGVTPIKNVVLAVSGDFAPVEYAYVRAKSAAAASAGYFVGDGGTSDAERVGHDLYKVAYGGLASPYTDSLGSDALYTTQITQGMADRRSAGNSYKTALIFTSATKQLRLIADEGWYQYTNDISRNLTSEFNADATYFFNRVRPGAYKGFFVRVRLSPRQQPTVPYGFEYQRFQTEYDF